MWRGETYQRPFEIPLPPDNRQFKATGGEDFPEVKTKKQENNFSEDFYMKRRWVVHTVQPSLTESVGLTIVPSNLGGIRPVDHRGWMWGTRDAGVPARTKVWILYTLRWIPITPSTSSVPRVLKYVKISFRLGSLPRIAILIIGANAAILNA